MFMGNQGRDTYNTKEYPMSSYYMCSYKKNGEDFSEIVEMTEGQMKSIKRALKIKERQLIKKRNAEIRQVYHKYPIDMLLLYRGHTIYRVIHIIKYNLIRGRVNHNYREYTGNLRWKIEESLLKCAIIDIKQREIVAYKMVCLMELRATHKINKRYDNMYIYQPQRLKMMELKKNVLIELQYHPRFITTMLDTMNSEDAFAILGY
jgi:hypothetical protein